MMQNPGRCIDVCGRPVARIGDCFDVPYSYIYRAPEIAAGTTRTDLFQVMDDDADFIWLSTKVSERVGSIAFSNATGNVRFRDGRGYYLSNLPLGARLAGGVLLPEVFITAGARIGIEINNIDAFDLEPVIRFNGLKRFYRGSGGDMGANKFWPAPWMLGGLGAETPAGFTDFFYQYVFPPTDLAAGQVLLNQSVLIDADSDFLWRGLAFGDFLSGGTSSAFAAVRFQDSDGYFRSNSRILLPSLGGPLDTPGVIFPEIVLPARGVLSFEIENTDAALTIDGLSLVFYGVKRYRSQVAA